MLYAKSTGWFYSREIHGDNMPSDAVEITDDAYHALFAAQATGKRITSDDAGLPVAVDHVEDPEAVKQAAVFEATASLTIEKLARALQTGDKREINQALASIDAARADVADVAVLSEK